MFPIDVTFNRDDYRKVAYYGYLHKMAFRLMLPVAILLFMFLFSLYNSYKDGEWSHMRRAAPYLAVVAVLAGMPFLLFENQVRKNIRSRQVQTEFRRLYSFDEAGMQISDPQSGQMERFGWDQILKMIEKRDYFLCYMSPSLVMAIPRRYMSPDEISEVRRLVRQQTLGCRHRLRVR